MKRLQLETFMAVKLIVAVLVFAVATSVALAQERSAAKLKEDTQKVVNMIANDRAKLLAYCETLKVSEQIDQADPNKDDQKLEDLNQRMDELNGKIGPEYVSLMQDLQDIDPNSPDGLEIGTTLAALDKLCS